MNVVVSINLLVFRLVEIELEYAERHTFGFIIFQLPWWDLKTAIKLGKSYKIY